MAWSVCSSDKLVMMSAGSNAAGFISKCPPPCEVIEVFRDGGVCDTGGTTGACGTESDLAVCDIEAVRGVCDTEAVLDSDDNRCGLDVLLICIAGVPITSDNPILTE